MKLFLAASAGLFLAMSTEDSLAFAPSKFPTTSKTTSLAIFANVDEESSNNKKSMKDFFPEINSNFAPSLLLASLLAVSTVSVTTPTIPLFVDSAHAATKTVEAPQQKKVESSKKISNEEKDLNKAKSNLNLSKSTLKAYEKLSSDAKSANKKALSALQSATKDASIAKGKYLAVSDKLSAAKSQKMPTSAVQELSVESATLKQISKEKDKIFNDASKLFSKTEKEVQDFEKAIQGSQKAIKKAEKNVKKAEKSFKRYSKKIKKQLKKQEQKVKALESQAGKLKSLKEKETKELSSKQKDLKSEVENLQKLKNL